MNQFTKQAQQALQLAAEAAEKLSHSYIGTEHILLGLRREEALWRPKCFSRTALMSRAFST